MLHALDLFSVGSNGLPSTLPDLMLRLLVSEEFTSGSAAVLLHLWGTTKGGG